MTHRIPSLSPYPGFGEELEIRPSWFTDPETEWQYVEEIGRRAWLEKCKNCGTRLHTVKTYRRCCNKGEAQRYKFGPHFICTRCQKRQVYDDD